MNNNTFIVDKKKMSIANQSSHTTKRIAKNTVLLYFRMLFSMIVSFYTSRVILGVLGVEDYGTYNVVGGFVAMFSILSSSLSAAIARFITYELGTGNKQRLSVIFSTSITIQCILIGIIICLIELLGVWYVNNKLVIDGNRIIAAQWVLQFSLITFCVNLISVPYNAAIIAHEKMEAYAYISILDVLLKLGICLILPLFAVDFLILYALLLTLEACLIRLIYGVYCKKNFEECTYHFVLDKSLILEMFTFSGWNFIGAGSSVLRTSGVNVVINLFTNPSVNAARGLALMISGAIQSFSSSFIVAINPQITKSYAAKNFSFCFKLVRLGARISYYFMLLMAMPIILESSQLLNIWLNIVPPHTVLFVQLLVIYVTTESISYTMITLMLATGKIRNYQIVVGSCQLLNLPVSYILLKYGFFPESTVIVSILIAIICLFLRLIMLKRMVNFPIRKFTNDVLLNIIYVTLIASVVPIIFHYYAEECLLRFFSTILLTTFSILVTVWFLGCNTNERIMINKRLHYFIHSQK